jgi:hypothetical protein
MAVLVALVDGSTREREQDRILVSRPVRSGSGRVSQSAIQTGERLLKPACRVLVAEKGTGTMVSWLLGIGWRRDLCFNRGALWNACVFLPC